MRLVNIWACQASLSGAILVIQVEKRLTGNHFQGISRVRWPEAAVKILVKNLQWTKNHQKSSIWSSDLRFAQMWREFQVVFLCKNWYWSNENRLRYEQRCDSNTKNNHPKLSFVALVATNLFKSRFEVLGFKLISLVSLFRPFITAWGIIPEQWYTYRNNQWYLG